jgi:Bacterial Ig domain
MIPGEPPELMPLARDDSASTLQRHRITVPVLDNDSGDALTVSSVTQPTYGSVENNGSSVTYIPDPEYPDFHGIDEFTYTVKDVHDRTDTATVAVTVAIVEEFADIYVALETGSAPIYIWDEMSGWWAIDEIAGLEINGIHHETTMTITVAAGRRYYVWLHTPEESYCVDSCPSGWDIRSSPVGGYEAAYGYAAPTGEVPHWVSFGICE